MNRPNPRMMAVAAKRLLRVIAEAAALWESLSQNHPFIDGNKRTAVVAMYVFLSIDGLKLTPSHEHVWEFFLTCTKLVR